MRAPISRVVTLILFGLLIPAGIQAGETGKIAGTVVDKETGNPLPGVNVILVGTSMGAATDAEGEFFILFISPGLYDVRFSFIGYSDVTVENVRVTKDLTTNMQTIAMEPEAIRGEAITVVAEKPLIEINATNEVRVVRSEDIQNMPIRGFSAVAALQTGVVADGTELHVRGGRADEVGYYIDGVYVNNPYAATGRAGQTTSSGVETVMPTRAPMDVPNTALEEVSFQAGGFNAEYGSANAGIVSTTTREGREVFQASFEGLTDAYLPTEGDNPIAYSYGYNLLSAAVSGPIPGMDWLRFSFSGELKNRDDSHPSWGSHPVYTGELDLQTGRPANGEDFTDINGNGVRDVASTSRIVGPPLAQDEPYVDANGNGKYDPFFIRSEDIEYRKGPLPSNKTDRTMLSGNLVVDMKGFIGLPFKLKMGGSYYADDRIAYIHPRALLNYYNDNGTLRLRFPRETTETQTLYGRLSGALTNRTYFSLQVSSYQDDYEDYDPLYKRGEGRFLFADGSLSDTYPYMQYGKRYDYTDSTWVNPLLPSAGTPPPLSDSVAQFSFAGRVYDDYSRNSMSYMGYTGSITNQWRRHELKAGFDYRGYTIRYYRIAIPMRLASTFQNNMPYSPAQKDSLLTAASGRWDADGDGSITDAEYQAYYDNIIFDAYMNAYADNIGYDITGTRHLDEGDNRARKPIIAAYYLQDKLELKDLILNLGVRYDIIDPDNLRFNPETGGPKNIIIDGQTGQIAEWVYRVDTNENGEADADDKYRSTEPTDIDAVGKPLRIKSKVRELWSPRIGLAFPVTDRTVFHAQYGRFVQQPEMNRMFISYTRFVANMTQGNYTTSSNPELQPVVTTQYELGFKQLLTDDISMDATVFYKQMSGYVQIRNVTDEAGAAYPVNYALYTNGDYGTVKGLSFAFGMRRINRVQVNANYTLQYAGGTGSNSSRAFTIAWQDGNFPTFVSPLEYDQRHTGNITIDWRTSPRDRFPLFGVNILMRFGSGMRYTPSKIRSEIFQNRDPSVPIAGLNTGTMPPTFEMDMQIDKGFDLAGVRLNAYAQIENVLNRRNVVDVYAATGEPGNDNWLATAEGQSVWLDKYGDTLGSDLYYARIGHPYRWSAPRQIRLGIRVDL